MRPSLLLSRRRCPRSVLRRGLLGKRSLSFKLRTARTTFIGALKLGFKVRQEDACLLVVLDFGLICLLAEEAMDHFSGIQTGKKVILSHTSEKAEQSWQPFFYRVHLLTSRPRLLIRIPFLLHFCDCCAPSIVKTFFVVCHNFPLLMLNTDSRRRTA